MSRAALARLAVLALVLAGCGDNLMPNPGTPDAPPSTPDAAVDAAPDAMVDAANPEVVCDDTLDNDGDGATDCADSDCAAAPNCNPEVACNDTLDNDGDGATDCADSDCAAAPNCLPEGLCTDGTDNDLDGDTDCADADCAIACLAGCADGESTVTITGTGLPLPVTDTAAPVDVALAVPAVGWITGGAVKFTITHTYDGDLAITLTSPAGQVLGLSENNGGSGDNYVDTVLADSGATPVSAGTAPFTGTFQPDQAFSTIDGASAMGSWHVGVEDQAAGDDGTVDAVELYLCVCNGTAGCETNLACQDGMDNDGDTLIDCADPDCSTVAQCIPESACADGLDNDLDGKVDCTDGDCAGIGTCEQPEATCGDGLDNDGDTLTDCADPDCTPVALCSPEVDCGNGLDDDGDGLADCLDPGCDGIGGCELGTEVSCTDGLDNDGDGAADCADADCAGGLECAVASCPTGTSKAIYTATGLPIAIPDNSPGTPAISTITVPGAGLVSVVAVQVDLTQTYDADLDISLVAPGGTVELSTDNGGNGDNYAGTVFADSAATAITAGTAPFTGVFQPEQPLAALAGTASNGDWSLSVADDANGDTGSIVGYRLLTCQCDSGSGGCEFGPIACRNGADDDGDGLSDCADPGCAGDPTCIPEAVCDDGIDNDLDGATDCLDANCDGVAGCETGTEVSCTDGFDNDGDGQADCLDPDCALVPACIVELDCANGLDDDGDGAIDCADPDCGADLGCTPEIDCGNGLDDDGDGNIDCLDQGCDGLQGCELGTEVSCDDGFDNDGDGATDCADANCSALMICAITVCPSGTSKVLYTATDVPLAIPDNSPTTPAVSTITGAPGLVTAAAVRVDLTHTYDADVDIFLAAPGATVELSTDNGSGNDNYVGTVFTDTAATAITAGTAPFTGRFRPEQALAAVRGAPGDGAWSLRVGDDAGGDLGTLTGYQLLTCQCPAGACELGLACTNGLDDDGDGDVDCADADCGAEPICIGPEHVCNDGLDDNGNGLTDCADPECAWACTALGAGCTAGNQLLVYGATDLPQAISATGTPTVNSNLAIPATGTIVSAAARFTATHTYDGDITLDLTSPAPTLINLTSGNGSGGDNYTGTVFVDTAATAITAGAAPFAGSYRPEQPLGTFASQPITGTWHAQLRDTAGGDGGTWSEFTLAACVAP